MTPRRAKCVVCMELPKEPGITLCAECRDSIGDWNAVTPDGLVFHFVRRARAFERKHATKAAHGEAMRNVYQHYKGGEYRRLLPDVVRMERPRSAANHDEVKMVVYACMKTGIVWVRPLAQFTEPVVWRDGVTRPRFDLVKEFDLVGEENG